MSNFGYLVISLDFEKMWGIHDKYNWEEYKRYIKNVDIIVPRLLKLFKKYNISATWATVGLLFCKSTDEMSLISQKIEKPSYSERKFSAYAYFDYVENDDQIHFAPELIKIISNTPGQEIGTHTFSHYYCKERGQTVSQFRSDLEVAIELSEENGFEIKSLVFPRNQYSNEYLKAAKELGIVCFRGLEQNWLNTKIKSKKLRRLLVFASSYFPIVSGECYSIEEIKADQLYNIKSSFFFRAASKNIVLEALKMFRARHLMKKAAKKGLVCHIWFHPHNLSNNIDLGLKQVESLCAYYQKLNKKYNFKSVCMNELSMRV